MTYKLKRSLDIAGSIAIVLVTCPVQLAVASALYIQGKLNSAYSGPILYRAERVDENLNTFTMFKFRSMINSNTLGYTNVLIQRPGLTSRACIDCLDQGKERRDLTLQEMGQLDSQHNYTLYDDLSIIFRTALRGWRHGR